MSTKPPAEPTNDTVELALTIDQLVTVSAALRLSRLQLTVANVDAVEQAISDAIERWATT